MMQKIPLEADPIHFIGIGGIGMSGIAELLHLSGYKITGSDANENANVKRLRAMGIEITIGQAAENVTQKSVIVYSSAIKADNPELKEARRRRIPVVRRAEMLAELMRLRSSIAVGGSHGKTTTTTMIATLLDKGNFDPTVVNGGIINAYGSNTRLGTSEWMVAEADESDGTFLKLPALFSIITNADPEHLDHYGTHENMLEAFVTFATNVPFYGAAILCTDHPYVRQIAGRIHDRRFITYGTNSQADLRAVNIRSEAGGARFDVEIQKPNTEEKHLISDLFLPMPGEHNVLNALAAIAIATELGMSYEDVVTGLSSFEGVKRRFTQVGTYNNMRIIDDYAHHPIEITATLKAARQTVGSGKIMAVIQPHRYSRLESLFEDFCGCVLDADLVYVSDVYAAGEKPIEGYSAENYVEAITAHGHKDAHYLPSFDDLPKIIQEKCEAGDIIIMMGAGNITLEAYKLPEKLVNIKAA